MSSRYHLHAAIILLAVGISASGGRAEVASSQFAGSTPCGDEVRRFLAISNTSCEQVTWELALADDAGAGRPFELRARYRMPISGSPNHLDAGIALQLRGVWTSAPGSGRHQGRTMYTLTIDGRALQLALLERDLLQLLTAGSRLMVGNPGWSYTLNRREASAPRAARRMEALDAVPPGMAGEFEGRTPCQEIAGQLNLAVDAGCTKLKWRLTLFQDAATGRPTTYKHEGTLYRDGAMYGAAPRTGTWSVLRDSSSGALMYRLDQGQPGEYLLLIRADENVLFFLDKEGHVLVGDRSHSYTLNRSARRD
ncbi:MAG TPA: hypothetical protein VMN81_06595 [Vicinamibacterales bacterium]|nr:hypothetical protein [Vicinamibacterales bacterium]